MNRKTIGIAAAVATVVLLALAARGVWAPKPVAPPVAASTVTETQGIQLAAGDITVAAQAELRTTLAVTGSLKAVSSAVVKARVAGEVKSLLVREGDRVSAGQLIGQLDNTEYQLRLRQAEDQARAAQAQLDIAQRTLDNNKALVDQGFISRNALDTSVNSAAGANASLQAARAAADIARKAVRDSEIRSPIAGLVAQRLVQPGERVNLDARIVEIVDLSRLELEAAVAPEDVVQLRVGQTALVQIDGLAAAVTARVVRINPSAQTGTRAVLAYLELAPGASAAGLRQGLFARGSIELQRKSALVVPATALRLDQARPYLLTVSNGLAKTTSVSTGSRGDVLIDGQLEAGIEITAGLEAGTPVLRGTVGTLREGTRLTLPAAAGGAPTGPAAAAVVAAPAAPSPPATPR